MNDDAERRAGERPEEHGDASIFDRVMPEPIKRRIEAVVEGMLRDGRLKGLVGDLKIPKEIASHIVSQVDETKRATLEVIGRETRLFLERTSLADELARLLTQVSFEVRTQVRFLPRDRDAGEEKKKPRSRRPEKEDEEP